MLNRLKQYIEYKGLTIALVERTLGMSNGALSKPIKNHTAIGSDKLENILASYPDLSPTWLFTGRGEMLLNDEQTPTKHETAPQYLLDMLTQKDCIIREQAEQLGQLRERIKQLEQRLEKTVGDVSIGDTANVG